MVPLPGLHGCELGGRKAAPPPSVPPPQLGRGLPLTVGLLERQFQPEALAQRGVEAGVGGPRAGRLALEELVQHGAPPEWSKAVKSATLKAASSSTRGSGWAPSGSASFWECRAAQSRQARPEEAQEPSSGTAKTAL
eukprot:scaffold74249_cov69-Phaeocystis_antarctica.AAC.1